MARTRSLTCPRCSGTGKIEMKGTLGKRLRFLREERGMSLRAVEAALAQRGVDVSNAAVSQIETGHIKSPGFVAVMALADLYGVKAEELMTPVEIATMPAESAST